MIGKIYSKKTIRDTRNISGISNIIIIKPNKLIKIPGYKKKANS